MVLPYLRHTLHCLLFSAIFVYVQFTGFKSLQKVPADLDPWSTYGYVLATILYFFKLSILIIFPYALFTFAGMVFYDAFPKCVELTGPLKGAPFVCFRVVTRGDCPRLVREYVSRNLATCDNVGLENYCIEVVTQKAVGVAPHGRVRETVVPEEYRSKNGTLFKARNLQYCLEDGVDQLSDKDYIVHLDEDSLLTEGAVKGIVNFMLDGTHAFGAGLITYANEEISSWMAAFADTLRVGDFLGKSRFQFMMFHKPFFGWTGSFIVMKVSAERDVTFDFGPDGSIVEDNYFSMKAFEKGYTFNVVEGEIWEKPALSIFELIRQRKRWTQGLLLLAKSRDIPWRYKFALNMLTYSSIVSPLLAIGAMATVQYVVPVWPGLMIVCNFVIVVGGYTILLGAIKSYSIKKSGVLKYVMIFLGIVACGPVMFVIMVIAGVWAVFGEKHQFVVTPKEWPESVTV